MLVKMLLALAIMISLLNYGQTINIPKIRNSVSDKEIETQLTITDTALIKYYNNHYFELPDGLNEDILKTMNLNKAILDYITYTKTGEKTYTLTATLNNGNTLKIDQTLTTSAKVEKPNF